MNFASLICLLPDSHQDRKRYLALFKEKCHNVKDITSMIDKLDKQLSKVQERVEKFGVEKFDSDKKFVSYVEKMNDFKKRLHDGDSAVSCQALVMLLSNPKLREPCGSKLRALLDQVIPNLNAAASAADP